jgi:transposase
MLHVGIDAAAESFVPSIFHGPARCITAPQPFSNSEKGIAEFAQWLAQQGVFPTNALLCVENTGVYSEVLCYQLHERGFPLALLDPKSISKAFPTGGPKSDPTDSRKIAEFGARYSDKLKLWEPQQEIVEQIRVILSTREQLVQQKTATQNTRSTLARKVIQTPAANRALEATLENLKAQIVALEKELQDLIKSHPSLIQAVTLLMTAPGVGWLLSAHMLVLTRGFTEVPNYRKMAQYLGIAPNEHTSGTSIRRKPRSRGYGPPVARKLLHLAARSVRTHDTPSRRYFERKIEEGKPKALVFNNIANKLLKRLCAMLRDQTTYVRTPKGVDPRHLALA